MSFTSFVEEYFIFFFIPIALYVVVMTVILVFNDWKNKRAKKEEKPKENAKDISRLYPLYSIRGMLDHYKQKYRRSKAILANIELLNGLHRSVTVLDKGGYFEYNKKSYVIDDSLKYWHIDAKMYALDYHENISIPIARKIPTSDISEAIERIDARTIKYAFNPKVLSQFLAGDVAEGVIKSGEMSEFMRQIRLIIIVIGVLVLVHFLIYAQKSGIFAQIQASI